VAGLLGANRLIGSPLSQNDLINLAAAIEGHPDNTTPAISGGLVASAVEADRVYSVSVPVSEKIRFAAFHPPFELKTEASRSVLPETYHRKDAVYNLSRSALMTASLFSGKTENLRVAVQDKIHQPYRLGLIQDGDTVFRLSYELGSLGTYISGAGPTIIALIDTDTAPTFQKHALKSLEQKGITGWKLNILDTDAQGATVSIA
jgi:homoserine kinase